VFTPTQKKENAPGFRTGEVVNIILEPNGAELKDRGQQKKK
jgi:hypothetical protein